MLLSPRKNGLDFSFKEERFSRVPLSINVELGSRELSSQFSFSVRNQFARVSTSLFY